MVLSWDVYGASMVIPWDSHGTCIELWYPDETVMGLLSDFRGSPMVRPWCSRGTIHMYSMPMRVSWYAHGASLGVPWESHGVIVAAMVLPWGSHGTYLEF